MFSAENLSLGSLTDSQLVEFLNPTREVPLVYPVKKAYTRLVADHLLTYGIETALEGFGHYIDHNENQSIMFTPSNADMLRLMAMDQTKHYLSTVRPHLECLNVLLKALADREGDIAKMVPAETGQEIAVNAASLYDAIVWVKFAIVTGISSVIDVYAVNPMCHDVYDLKVSYNVPHNNQIGISVIHAPCLVFEE